MENSLRNSISQINNYSYRFMSISETVNVKLIMTPLIYGEVRIK